MPCLNRDLLYTILTAQYREVTRSHAVLRSRRLGCIRVPAAPVQLPSLRWHSTAVTVDEPRSQYSPRHVLPSTTNVESAAPRFQTSVDRKYEFFTNVEITSDGVALIQFDCPGKPVNTISFKLADEAKLLWDNEIASNPRVKAVVFASAKKGNFIAGADIFDIKAVEDKSQLVPLIEDGLAFFKRMKASKIPMVAAIDGPALGGGLEWALWCDYRICTDSPKTKLGLPEVKLGLLPGFGGTQNLYPLVGLQAALDMMLTGKDIRPAKAKKMGLVDQIVAPASLETVALTAAAQLAAGTLKPKRKAKSLMNRLLEDNALGRMLIFSQVEKMIAKNTNGKYPAPLAIIDCIKYGISQSSTDQNERFRFEREQFAKLAATPESGALIGIFDGMTKMKKHNFGKDTAVPVQKVAIVGAGLMGAGIAQVSADKGKYDVLLHDRNDEAVARGSKYINDNWTTKFKKKQMTEYELNSNKSRVTCITDTLQTWDRHMRGADLIIEAVFEDLALKQQIVDRMEQATLDHCIFATNTSAIPIAKIAEKARRPHNIIGMHYFSPVPSMPLLEIIPHAGSSDVAIATAYEVGAAQGKTCVVVKDVPGFYVNRCLGPYLVEVSALVQDGVSLEQLDAAIKDFGMPVGPITLADEVGIDVTSHVAKFLSNADLGVRMSGGDVTLMENMIGKGWLGKKSGQGFYTYSGKKKVINNDVKQYVKSFAQRNLKLSNTEVQNRIVSRCVSLTCKNYFAICSPHTNFAAISL
jgi:enoyl-CoA hydratase / long-chain 3-hydroxyacyl-CoA dehydrogenase